MSTDNKKFTATLVTQEDKNTIVDLREQTGLAEKELMTLVIKYTDRNAIATEATAIVAQQEIDRKERKDAAYALLKQKMKEAREATKAAKPAKEPKAPKAAKAGKNATTPVTA